MSSERIEVRSERGSFSPLPSFLTTNVVGDAPARVWRIGLIGLMLNGLFLLLLLRLLDMQILDWQQYEPPSNGLASGRNTVDDTTPWGVIVDRDGNLLASDRFTYRITATPKFIYAEDYSEIAQRIASAIHTSPGKIENLLLENSDKSYLIIAPSVDFEQGQQLLVERQERIAQNDFLLEHIQIGARPRRFYPQGLLASQILGFLNAERVPVLGIERYYRNFLPSDGVGLPQGQHQPRTALQDEILRFLPNGSSKGLVLTIDRTIQYIIEKELREGVRLYKAQSGTVIVMNPRTGAILGMANWPTFNGNRYESENQETFTNAAISAQYEPGSIYKVITVAAALDSNAVEATTIFTDTGSITIGERTIQNSNRQAVGPLSVADALAHSNNVVTVQIAEKVGVKSFYDYVARFGFGVDTNIDLSGEVPGLVKQPGDINWSLSDLATNSFGQGIAVTPIQMINAVAAIANDGKMMRPHVVQNRVAGDNTLETQATVAYQAIKPETAAQMRELMVHVVEAGNSLARVAGYTVAGKSGTAEIATPEGYTLDETIASFVGFAPAKDPQFVVLVKLNQPDPSISRWAVHTAAPIFSRITNQLLHHMNIPPDNVRNTSREWLVTSLAH